MKSVKPICYNYDILKFKMIKYCGKCTNSDLYKIKNELNDLLSNSQMFTSKHDDIFEQLRLFIDALPKIDDDNKPSRGTILKMTFTLPSHIALIPILTNKFVIENITLQLTEPFTFMSLCGIKTHNENFIRTNYERNNKIS